MLYKVLTKDMRSGNGGRFDWTNWVGKPTPAIWPLEMCLSGYHATDNPMRWPIVGMRVFECTVGRGEYDPSEDKGVYETLTLGVERPDLVPDWWHEVETFIKSIPSLPLEPVGEPAPSWRVFATQEAAQEAAQGAAWSETREAAWSTARRAAWSAARGAAWSEAREAAWSTGWATTGEAARDATLMATILVLPESFEYRAYAQRRWDVWLRGYGLYADVGGVFYVYQKEHKERAGCLS